MTHFEKMVATLKSAHAEIANFDEQSKIEFYQRTYTNMDTSANEAAWHFTAFRMAFLD